jgi:hypothetical protein
MNRWTDLVQRRGSSSYRRTFSIEYPAESGSDRQCSRSRNDAIVTQRVVRTDGEGRRLVERSRHAPLGAQDRFIDRARPNTLPYQLDRTAHRDRHDDLHGLRKQRAVDGDILL